MSTVKEIHLNSSSITRPKPQCDNWDEQKIWRRFIIIIISAKRLWPLDWVQFFTKTVDSEISQTPSTSFPYNIQSLSYSSIATPHSIPKPLANLLLNPQKLGNYLASDKTTYLLIDAMSAAIVESHHPRLNFEFYQKSYHS
jgi:hypothetical protein